MSTDPRFHSPERGLDAGWLDYNGHLNMAYYNVLFDNALEVLFDEIGCGGAYRHGRNLSFFTAQAHVNYVRELKPDSRVRVAVRVLDLDAKRIHFFEELYHVEGWLSATSENMQLHIDMDGPKVTPMPDDILERFTAMAQSHTILPPDPRIGRRLGIERK